MSPRRKLQCYECGEEFGATEQLALAGRYTDLVQKDLERTRAQLHDAREVIRELLVPLKGRLASDGLNDRIRRALGDPTERAPGR